MWMLIFTLLPLSALAYIGWHVWCLLPISWIWKVLILVLMTGAFLLLFAGFMRMTDRMPMPLAIATYEIGTSSIIILLYLFMLFLVLDLGRLLHLLPRSLFYHNWWTAGGIALGMFVLFLYGHLHYQHKHREEIQLSTEKRLSKPMKIVAMSDLHIGYHNRRSELHRWVDMINAEQPDLILIAGDIIDGSMRPVIEQQMQEEFKLLKAPVYACIGKLQDSCVTVGDLCIIGRDDRSNFHRDSLGVLMKNADRSKYYILLDHQPYHLDQAERQQVDLQFSGHTHHGQVWPISWITEHVYECAFGPYQRGNTRYYISSGLGLWGGKFRIGTRSEYVVITLNKSQKTQ